MKTTVKKVEFGKIEDRVVYKFVLENEFLRIEVCELGATVLSVKVSGREVVLGFNSIEGYLATTAYLGATIGRTCNRIKNSAFTLFGKEYKLSANEGKNHLHGGAAGYDKRIFDSEECLGGVKFSLFSPDGDGGYPGNLNFSVTYTLIGDALNIEYFAKSDADTLWCPTNHTYFNLFGDGVGDCTATRLKIRADRVTKTDGELIPTDIISVRGTPYDFSVGKLIGADIESAGGYDNNFLLGEGDGPAAVANGDAATLEVYSDMPCIQFYSGGELREVGRGGKYTRYSGFALEPQYMPNAVNMKGFSVPYLRAGESGKHYIKFVFKSGNALN